MKFNSFTSKLLTSVAALALTSVCANSAFGKDHHVSKGFKVIAVRTLDNTKVADLLLVNGQGGKQFLYLRPQMESSQSVTPATRAKSAS
jgi:hypothetical protein